MRRVSLARAAVHLILLWLTAGFDAALGLGHHHVIVVQQSFHLAWELLCEGGYRYALGLRPGIPVDAERRHAYR